MQPVSGEVKADLLVRLRRIEGQVRGVQRMLDADRDCAEILQQLSAVRSALQSAVLLFAQHYAVQCMSDPQDGLTDEELVEQLLTVLSKA